MKRAFGAGLLVFALFLGTWAPTSAAPAADEEARFFVLTSNGFIKGLLKARHEFEDGFTTEASPALLQVARVMGAKVYPVQRLDILQAVPAPAQGPTEPAAKPDNPGKPDKPEPSPTAEPTPEPRITPYEQVSWGVAMLYGDDSEPTGGVDVNVAVLDTGVDQEHPDLVRRIADCRDFSQRKSSMIEGVCDDDNGHGTHVAGIIAADGGEDGLGIFGVAPEANLMTYKVCGKNGSCWSDDIAIAIRTAADNGANVINMSLGSDGRSSLIEDAVLYASSKDVLIVAAAGNDGPYENSIDYPGAFEQVVAVGAIDDEYDVAEWSSRGINETTEPYSVQERDVEFAAPGVYVESTSRNGSYAVLSGTSMASPHVAGLAAKLWAFGDDAATATRDALHDAAVDILPSGDDNASGWGLPLVPVQE